MEKTTKETIHKIVKVGETFEVVIQEVEVKIPEPHVDADGFYCITLRG